MNVFKIKKLSEQFVGRWLNREKTTISKTKTEQRKKHKEIGGDTHMKASGKYTKKRQ